MATLTGADFESEVLAPIYSNPDDLTTISTALNSYVSAGVVTNLPGTLSPIEGYTDGNDGLVLASKTYTIKGTIPGQTTVVTDAILSDTAINSKGVGGNLTGDNAANVLGGNDGNNSINGKNGDDIIVAGGGKDTVNAGNDNDQVYGGDGRDNLNGQNGNDTIDGGNANDKINGGSGDDQISGGQGNDVLTGSTGNDVFLFAANDGADVIKDFKEGDTLKFEGSGAAGTNLSASGFEAGSPAEGSGVLINFNDGGSVLLKGVKLADLVFDDATDSFHLTKGAGNVDDAS